MAGWDDYGDCCRRTARGDAVAAFCPECRHALFRCPSPGCGTLVTPLGHCPACVGLRLSLEKGAVLQARVGDCLSVPLVLANEAACPLRIAAIFSEGSNQSQAAVPLAWDRLDAGQARSVTISAGPFEHGGLDRLRLTIVVSAVIGGIEEAYVFSGDMAVDVEGRDPTQVVQHFNLAGADFGTAGMVVANPHASGERRRREIDGLAVRTAVPLERAERFELDRGYRGYREPGFRIPRDVRFSYVGFPTGDRPPDGSLLQRAVIRCGRNGRLTDGRQTAEPNDLCLRVYDERTGALEREASAAISRHALDLVLANDRLHARGAGASCVTVNREALVAGALRALASGDTIVVTAGGGKSVAFAVNYDAEAGAVSLIRVEKVG